MSCCQLFGNVLCQSSTVSDGPAHGRSIVVIEHASGADAGLPGSKCWTESARPPVLRTTGMVAVAQTVHLVQPAGLIAGRASGRCRCPPRSSEPATSSYPLRNATRARETPRQSLEKCHIRGDRRCPTPASRKSRSCNRLGNASNKKIDAFLLRQPESPCRFSGRETAMSRCTAAISSSLLVCLPRQVLRPENGAVKYGSCRGSQSR